jgi:hypothetical protein
MNIFILDEDPIKAAKDLCDKHVRSKMIIESAIALQSCFTQDVLNHKSCPRTKTGKIRKSMGGYANHPSSKWCRETSSNFSWLLNHTKTMLEERRRRWPLFAEHFTASFIDWVIDNQKNINVPTGPPTQYAIAINKDKECCKLDGFKNFSSVEKYRHYYVFDKPFATWTNTTTPEWFVEIAERHLKTHLK